MKQICKCCGQIIESNKTPPERNYFSLTLLGSLGIIPIIITIWSIINRVSMGTIIGIILFLCLFAYALYVSVKMEKRFQEALDKYYHSII